MGLFLRRSEPDEERSIDLSGYASLWASSLPYSPVAVSQSTALTHAASSACIDTLATSVSSLPLDTVRMEGDQRVPLDPGAPLISAPSQLVQRDVWLYQAMQSMLTDGNVFGVVTRVSPRGYPMEIELLDPATVTYRRVDTDGRPKVSVGGDDRAMWPLGDIWHVPGRFVRPGSPFADSPVDRARATIGAAIAARDFGSKFFGDGGHPGALLQTDQEITEEQAKAAKASWLAAVKGSREPAVLGSGWQYEPIMVDPNDSQFIELMQFCTEEACRFWRVPPSMIYSATSGQNVTYANVTQADLAYLKHSLEGHLVRFERALTALLPRPQFARFNRNAFLRSDPVTRSEVVDRRLRNETMTVNEARALEDEQPFPASEFDEPGIPGGSDVAAPDTQETPDA